MAPFLPPASAILHAAENFLEGRVLTTCPLLDYMLPRLPPCLHGCRDTGHPAVPPSEGGRGA